MKLWIYLSFLLLVTASLSQPVKNSKKGFSTPKAPRDILIVSSVNGDLTGLDIDNGKILWKIKNGPLLSQSISNIEFNKDGRSYRIVPSLEGELYMLDSGEADSESGSSLRALPVTAESLFSAGFQLANDALIVGNKDQSVYSIDPLTGKMIFNCSSGGCGMKDVFSGVTIPPSGDENSSSAATKDADKNASGQKQEEAPRPGTSAPPTTPRMLVKRHSHTVRAIDLVSGMEKWNFSVAHDQLAILTGGGSVPKSGSVPSPPQTENDITWLFNVEQGAVLALKGRGQLFSRFLWQQKVGAALSSAWTLHICSTGEPFLKSLSILHGAAAWRSWESNAAYTTPNLPRAFHHFTASPPLHSSYKRQQRKEQSTVTVHPNYPLSLYSPETHAVAEPSSANGIRCSAKRTLYLGEYEGQLYVKIESEQENPSAWKKATESFGNERISDSEGSPRWVALPKTLKDEPYIDGDATNRRPPGGRATRSTALQSFFQANTIYEASIDYEPSYAFIPPWGEGDTYYPYEDRPILWTGMRWFEVLLFCCLVGVILHLSFDKYRCIKFKSFEFYVSPNLTPLHSNGVADCPLPPNHLIFPPVVEEKVAAPKLSVDTRMSLSSPDSGVAQLSLFEQQSTAQLPPFQSRYEADYKHVQCLARGGFGLVFKATNNIDCRDYAIKRICMKKNAARREKIFREVKTLASLEHPGIVRYYMAWVENPPDGWQEERDRQLLSKEPHLQDAFSLGSDLQLDPAGTRSGGSVESASLLKSSHNPEGVLSRPLLSSFSDPQVPQLPQKHMWDSRDDLIVFDRGDSLLLRDVESRSNELDTVDEDFISSEDEGSEREDCCVHNRSHSPNSAWSSKPSKRSQQHRSKCPRKSMEDNSSFAKEYLYIQMQLCKSESLRGWLSTHTSEQRVRSQLYDMFVQIVDAVAYLHKFGLIHRDLKPSNILFDLNDRIKVVDFGLVTYDGVKMTEFPCNTTNLSDSMGLVRNLSMTSQHTDKVGTYLYMSPEQETGGKYNYKVDVFALGLIFIELLIAFPTDMERYKVLGNAKRQNFPKDFCVTYPDECVLIKNLLSEHPDERPACEEILQHPLLAPVFEGMRQQRIRNVSSSGNLNSTLLSAQMME